MFRARRFIYAGIHDQSHLGPSRPNVPQMLNLIWFLETIEAFNLPSPLAPFVIFAPSPSFLPLEVQTDTGISAHAHTFAFATTTRRWRLKTIHWDPCWMPHRMACNRYKLPARPATSPAHSQDSVPGQSLRQYSRSWLYTTKVPQTLSACMKIRAYD